VLLAFAHLPKTGGTTLVGILRRSFGLRHCDVEPLGGRPVVFRADDYLFTQRFHPRLDSIVGHQVSPASDLSRVRPDVFYCAVLRDPMTRVASQYQHLLRHGDPPPFEEVVKRPWWYERQTRQLAGGVDVDAACEAIARGSVLIGLTEAFDEFLAMLRLRVDDARLDVRYRRRNVAPDNAVARRMLDDPRTRGLIEETNRSDLELYRRVRTDLYPAQRAAFPDLAAEVRRVEEAGPPPPHAAEWFNRIHRNLIYKPALAVARRRRGGVAAGAS
jgi:hypothetical protein